MRKLLLAAVLAVAVVLAGCGGGSEEGGDAAASGPTELELWSFQELHLTFFEKMAERWNEENPDRQITLNATAYPYDDMHNNLLVALQSGSGAPDIVDIEISRFPSYLRGTPQLRSFNEYVDPVRDDFVDARFDIYAADGEVYGLPFHVGATVMYYNVEIMEAAGVDIDSIQTWDDYVEAGRQVVENTDAIMTTVELTDQWTFWPMISQQKSDYVNSDGEVILDNQTNIDTLQFLHDMVHVHEIAQTTPGGYHHAEEYYGFMNEGGAASLMMPFWYLGRFTDYMPDLQGKIAVRPMPVFDDDDLLSAGMGGTGTAVPTLGDHVDLAAEFVAFAKLSEEGNILIWEDLGFDPPRHTVWDSEELAAQNKFTEYFTNGENIFTDMLPLTDQIHPVSMSTDIPDLIQLVKSEVMVQALGEQSATPAEALQSVAEQIRSN